MLKPPEKRILKGTTPEGLVMVGPSIEAARNAVFAIICFDDDKDMPDLIGTGTYISYNGLFVTARHSLMHVIKENSLEQNPGRKPAIIHLNIGGGFVLRPILKFHTIEGTNSDIAIGIATPMTSDKTGEPLYSNYVTLQVKDLQPGEDIVTFAYPATDIVSYEGKPAISLHADLFHGQIVEKISDKKYRTNMHIHGGASGGPVFSKDGMVIGINSSSFAGETDLSFITPIRHILGIEVHDIILPGQTEPTPITIAELANKGFLNIKNG